jgi:hypothetical protein
MKRFWLVLLSLGLVMAFSASALAVDVKFSGQFYVGGMWLDKTTFKKDTATDGPSTAFFYQKLRLTTEFVAAPGVKLITRADIMEKAWGTTRTTPGTAPDSLSQGTTAENENIAFDMAYVEFATPIGLFKAGYQPDGAWGTVFGDSMAGAPCITYIVPGTFTIIGKYCKVGENSYTAKNPTQTAADRDNDSILAAFIYGWKGGQAGLLGKYYHMSSARAALGNATQWYLLIPYVKAQLGPVALQSEVYYGWGKYPTATGEKDLNNLTAWVDATATFGPVYFGGSVAYVSGDDPTTTDKLEGGILSGGADWNPCLLLWNYDRNYWVGGIAGQGTATNAGYMSNAWFFQGRAGVKPTAKFDIMGSVSYAFADKKPAGYTSDSYGWEIDVTGTYKITNNLSYMLGVGYLMTGDYFKGATVGTSIKDNYIVVNKLTLTF